MAQKVRTESITKKINGAIFSNISDINYTTPLFRFVDWEFKPSSFMWEEFIRRPINDGLSIWLSVSHIGMAVLEELKERREW